jgi:hypothetical protein
MALNRIIADSIADGTVVASDIADGTITLAKLQSGLLPPATANSAAAYANAAFATANTGTASGSYANSAFATANTGTAAGSYANSAFATANTGTAAGSYANSAFSTANTTSTNVTNAGGYANSAFAKANTAGVGTVTSVATGNGLSGGTITTTGTLVLACPSFNSVGSYVWGAIKADGGTVTWTSGSNYSAGGGNNNVFSQPPSNVPGADPSNNLSGTWKWMGAGGGPLTKNANDPTYGVGILCRVS